VHRQLVHSVCCKPLLLAFARVDFGMGDFVVAEDGHDQALSRRPVAQIRRERPSVSLTIGWKVIPKSICFGRMVFGNNGGAVILGIGQCPTAGVARQADDLIARLSAGCPWRDEPRGERCGAQFADLPPRRPPDIRATDAATVSATSAGSQLRTTLSAAHSARRKSPERNDVFFG
jgi:hypothetical protein